MSTGHSETSSVSSYSMHSKLAQQTRAKTERQSGWNHHSDFFSTEISLNSKWGKLQWAQLAVRALQNTLPWHNLISSQRVSVSQPLKLKADTWFLIHHCIRTNPALNKGWFHYSGVVWFFSCHHILRSLSLSNHNGWLGIKHQVTYSLLFSFFLFVNKKHTQKTTTTLFCCMVTITFAGCRENMSLSDCTASTVVVLFSE